MAGKKESSALWRQTSVLIRADIFDQAGEQDIDISEECNRALALRLGIDYRQQKIPEGHLPAPVIIAPNTAPGLPKRVRPSPGAPAATAIINADDPRAAGAVKSGNLPKEKTSREVPASGPAPAPVQEKKTTPLRPIPVPEKAKKPAPARKKGDSPKKFFSAMVQREDGEGVFIAKDEMYYAFERWCRDHRVLTVPDRKAFSVALKNQFAVRERNIDGTPSWIGVRLK